MGGWGIKKMQKIVALHPLSFHVLSHSTPWTHGREEERGDPPWSHNPWLNQEPGFRVAPWSNWLNKQTEQADKNWRWGVSRIRRFLGVLPFLPSFVFGFSPLFVLGCGEAGPMAKNRQWRQLIYFLRAVEEFFAGGRRNMPRRQQQPHTHHRRLNQRSLTELAQCDSKLKCK